jgi:hypothetical protein
MTVQLERALHGFAKAFQTHVLHGVPRRARAVATVERAVRVKEKHCPGLVVIELEERQIHAVGLNEANADEAVEQFRQRRLTTSNLLVQLLAVQSGDATENDEERFAGFPGLGEAGIQIVVDPRAFYSQIAKAVLERVQFRLSRYGGAQQHDKDASDPRSPEPFSVRHE